MRLTNENSLTISIMTTIHHLVAYKAIIKQVLDCWLNKISYFETYLYKQKNQLLNHLIIYRDTATQ